MKKKFLLLIACAAVFCSKATVRTINNNPGGLAQFSDVQSAVNASTNGDTIYVHGSVSNYGNVDIIDKKLTIIGPGMSPDKTTSLTAIINFIGFANLNSGNCNGSAVIGMVIRGGLTISNNGSGNTGYPVDGMKVIRNKFVEAGLTLNTGNPFGSVHMHDLLVEGNLFESSGLGGSPSHYFTNCTFINNVFSRPGGYYGSNFISGLVNCTNVVFDHNLFYVSPTLPSDAKRLFNDAVANLTLKNNLFINLDNLYTHWNGNTNVTNCSYQNNLTYNCVSNTPWTFGSNVNLGGNISNTNPQLADQAAVDAGTSNPLLNFSIASGPANDAGTDGKDLGVLFDQNSTMNWAYGRNSRLPYIYSMNVLNTSVPAGGILNVQLNARKAK